MMRRLRASVRGTASLLALTLVMVGVPSALLRWGRWPTAGGTDDWWDRLRDTVVSDAAVFVVLTVVVAVVWALFVTSVVVELVAALRGREAPRILLAGPLQRGARSLVVALVVTFSVSHPSPAPVFAATPTAATSPSPSRSPAVEHEPRVVALPPADPAATAAGSSVVSPAPTLATADGPSTDVVIVQRGDSAWQLAETHLGDGMRWRELWDLNHDTTQPDGRAWTDPQVLLPGWHLQLPIPAPSHPAPAIDGTGDAVHVVEPGDTLSGIAARYLGDPGRYPELVDANRDRTQPDGRRLEDPNLIRPGWRLLIPATGAPAPTVPSLPPVAPPGDLLAPMPAPPTTPPTSPTVPSTAEGPSTTRPTPVNAAPDDHREEGGSRSVPVLAGITGALVLASGLALRFARLRRRRGVRGAHALHVPSTPPEQAVVSAGDVPLVRWAGQAIAELVRDINPRQLTAAPVAVELSETAGIEILWDDQQHAVAPPGWTVTDGGWAWRHPYDPDAPVPVAALPASVPALVTIGQRDGRQLLVDLEGAGLLTVSGPPPRVDGFLRSLAVELAAGDELADAYVYAVGLDTGLEASPGQLERLIHADLEGSLLVVDGVRRSVRDALDAAGLSDTFRARVGAATPIDVTVVVAHGVDADVQALLDSVPERGGVAVVGSIDTVGHVAADVGPSAPGRAHISLGADGTGHLTPLGVAFHAAWLPLPSCTEIGTALGTLADLDNTDALAVEPAPRDALPSSLDQRPGLGFEPADAPAHRGSELLELTWLPDTADARPSSNGHDAAAGTDVPAAGDVDGATGLAVRVLGVPSVPARPQLGRRELILAVLLTCRGGSLSASAVQDAVWGGRPVEAKTVWNVVASTRRALGTFADGTPVMPSVDRVKQLLRLDARVSTDVALLRARFDAASVASSAEAIMLLRDGLALVEGPPFDGAGFDWAHRDQDVAEASTLIGQVVEMLVGLALDAGQVDVARDAVTRGLRGLPGDEALYRLRMRIEHQAGRHGEIIAAYDELTVYLNDLDAEPSAATTALYRELIRQTSPR
ncbi:MAG: hypothetical protein AMXMBFR46_12940 [Acidimicrobiia bacterium]